MSHCYMTVPIKPCFQSWIGILEGYKGEVSRIIFWRGVRPEVWKPNPYLRDFSPSKNGWFYCFFEIFANWHPFLRVFLPQIRPILQDVCYFCEMGPSSIFFLFKWDQCLRIFGEKVTHLGSTSPYAWTCEYPRGYINSMVWLKQESRLPYLILRDLRVRTVAKRHMRSSMFTASFILVSCVKQP